MAKNNNIEKQSNAIEAEEKKRLDSTRIFLIVFAAVACVGIIASLIFALLPTLTKERDIDYLKDNLSKYVNVPESLYTSYTVNIELPPVTDTDIEYEILELLCANKISPDTPVTNIPGITVGAGDVANIYYRGYFLNEDGTKDYFDTGCNFTDSIYGLEVGSGSFIPGFEYNLIGSNQKDYATMDKITSGKTEIGDIIHLTYSVYYADGQASLSKTALIDLSDPNLDKKWGEGFSAYFNVHGGYTIGEQFATGSGDDKKLTVETTKEGGGTDLYFDMSISTVYRISDDKDRLVVEAYFPYDYDDEKLKGKTAYFEVYIKSVQDYEVPEFNDEFITEKVKMTAEDLAEYHGETLVEKYRDYTRAKLEESSQESVRTIVEAQFWKNSIAGSTFYKLPEKEVEIAYNNYLAEIQTTYAGGYSSYYKSIDEFARAYLSLGATADWKAKLRSDAEYSIKQKLVFYYVVRELDLTPNDSEYQEIYDEIFGEYLQSYLDYYKITESDPDYSLKVENAKKEILAQYGEGYWHESVMYKFAIGKIIDRANVVYAQ
jgi:FKBP-type peptidyl-prolyl cis-trans isomerase (trigger factor)